MLHSRFFSCVPKRCFEFAAGAVLTLAPVLAHAEGIPHAWGINLQTPGSPLETGINDLHTLLLWIIAGICLFVLALLIFVVVRYNKWANPNPSGTTHNFKLEVIWTLIPVLILLVVAVPSFKLMYYQDRIPPQTDLTLKVTGHQWYWSYEFPDQGGVAFDSHALWDQPTTTNEQAEQLVKEASVNWLIKSEPLRMLEVDNRLVLPVGKTIKLQITAADVEHSWFITSLGINRMAVPGRNNEIWVKIDKPGLYYGQCSMICGTGHGYMPIVIEGVTPEQFANWVKSKKTAVGQNPSGVSRKFL